MEWTYLPVNDKKKPPTVIGYLPNAFSVDNISKITTWLKSNPNYQGTSYINDEWPIPRTQVWYHIQNKYFCPSWKGIFPRWESHQYDDTLLEFQLLVQEIATQYLNEWNNSHSVQDHISIPNINSCLVNRYRNGQDSIKPHRDSVESFGEFPTIIGVSIGATRTLKLEEILNKHSNFDFPLESGSIFIMAGSSQDQYYHSIIKEKNISQERFSLTFREWVHKDKS